MIRIIKPTISWSLGSSMSINHVVLQIKLEAIKSFLGHVDRDAGDEIENVFERNESGEFEDEDDFENAIFFPVMRQEIAARAVYSELNALIESELHNSAYIPWLESTKHRGPKSLDFNSLTLESIRDLKMVSDLPFGEIKKLIEEKYKINIKDLDGGDAFFKMREMVNAFKHRNGLIDFRKQEAKDIKLVERHKADIEHAYDAIDKANVFIKALWLATDREPKSPPSFL